MNKLIILLIFPILASSVFAYDMERKAPPAPSNKERKQFEKMLDERLNLTNDQKKALSANRKKHLSEMQKTVNEMEKLHTKIKNVYMLGIPKYQADIRTAGYKAELAILKQNAQKQKAEHRKNFENILTKEQRIEFEKIKKERRETMSQPKAPPS